ncbi:hypothetical protein [Tsukamurella tyrosinosolvens]|uniref:hypothetical protein n=1 Tax=Tsukamurella tyrosinosolvens TaxID=57704 RepID=UPI000DF681F5|nr:hypothetical protein [Tsukamurella tyrosinosolvens]MEC4613704.1 hypothetical protein [Tsukamurella tyrosinosolvens]RDB47822.1 hypothetical protein DVB87_11025 [Tsukamurella tyrosinosolvens]
MSETAQTTTLIDVRRAMLRVVVSGMREFKAPVPQQMIDLVERRADDLGPLPDIDKHPHIKPTWSQQLMGR